MEAITSWESPDTDVLIMKRKGLKFESDAEEVPLSIFLNNLNIEQIKELSEQFRILLGHRYLYIYRNDVTNPEHTYAKLEIGRIKMNDNGNLTEFIPDSNINLVSESFSELQLIPFFKRIKLKFNIPDIGNDTKQAALKLRREMNDKASSEQKRDDIVNALALLWKLWSQRDVLSIKDSIQVLSVKQGRWEILHANDKERYIETRGLAPCIGVVIRNPYTKDTALVHIDARTNIQQELVNLLNQITDNTDVTVDIIGGRPMDTVIGWEESMIKNLVRDQLIEIKDFFENRKIKVRNWDVWEITGNLWQDIKNIIIDKQTGQIFDSNKENE